jgi:hypothetical protein
LFSERDQHARGCERGRAAAENLLARPAPNPAFNPHLRQLLHVGYKVAAKMGPRYLGMLQECEPSISRNVTTNLFDRDIAPLFVG